MYTVLCSDAIFVECYIAEIHVLRQQQQSVSRIGSLFDSTLSVSCALTPGNVFSANMLQAHMGC